MQSSECFRLQLIIHPIIFIQLYSTLVKKIGGRKKRHKTSLYTAAVPFLWAALQVVLCPAPRVLNEVHCFKGLKASFRKGSGTFNILRKASFCVCRIPPPRTISTVQYTSYHGDESKAASLVMEVFISFFELN